MNNFVWQEIQSKRLRVIQKYKDELREPLSNFGRSTKKYSAFGAFYESYLYAFVIGLHENKRIDIKGHKLDTFNAIHEWQQGMQDILLKFIMVLLSMDNIRKEAEFDFSSLEMEDLDDIELKKRVANLINIIEEFANGGFEVIYKKYNDSPEDFEHYSSLKMIFDNTIKKSKLL